MLLLSQSLLGVQYDSFACNFKIRILCLLFVFLYVFNALSTCYSYPRKYSGNCNSLLSKFTDIYALL
jgi:hypothetical protein